MKQFRRVATRYGKLAVSYLVTVSFATLLMRRYMRNNALEAAASSWRGMYYPTTQPLVSPLSVIVPATSVR